MKRKVFMAVAAVFLMAPVAIASTAQDANSSSVVAGPQCQFSLSHYGGTLLIGGTTNGVSVLLNCTQEVAVKATVYVYIAKKLVTSEIFTIPAGADRSANSTIRVPGGKEGESYTLRVSPYLN